MNNYERIRKAKAIEGSNKKRILKINPDIPDSSGIYFLTRTDEEGFKFAYIGQARHILTRLAQHLVGYQRIDNSIRKHNLCDKSEYGYKINYLKFPESKLDEMEQYYIKKYANAGFQMRNETIGSQNLGKKALGDAKSPKGYRQGLAQGYNNAEKEIMHFLSTHCKVSLKKPENKVSAKQADKWIDKIRFENYKQREGEKHGKEEDAYS